MSPEQARGDRVDRRSDLFSLGSVMYAMSTGRPPFRAETSYGILRRVTDEQPRAIDELNSEIPAWLQGLIKKLMSKSADGRCDDADRLARQLEECVAHTQQPSVNALPKEVSLLARSVTRPGRMMAWLNRAVEHPNSLAATLVLSLAVMVGSAFVISGLPRQTDDATAAQKQRPEQVKAAAAEAEESETVYRTPVSPRDFRKYAASTSSRWPDDIDQQLNELDTDLDSLLRSLEKP